MFSPMLAFRSSGQIVTTTPEGWTPSPAVSLSTIESGSRSEARAAHHNEEAGSSHFARNPLVLGRLIPCESQDTPRESFMPG